MGLIPTPQQSSGIWNAIKGSLGLFGDTNKSQGINENSNLQPVDEYESKMSDDKIIELSSLWRKTYSVYYADIEPSQKLSFDYWIGKQKKDDADISAKDASELVDNLIFESLETFLPMATRANPDPLVTADPSEIGQEISKAVKSALVKWADDNKLRRKLAKITRHWSINRIGVGKLFWNKNTKEIKFEIINPKRFIFDKDGYIDEGGRFVGEYIGEKKKGTADLLTQMFPKKKSEIIKKCHGKIGTKLDYVEWWYKAEDVFFTMDDMVLGKYKNPNWNYDIEVQKKTNEENPEIEDQESEPEVVQGVNHLKTKAIPYVFLSMFSTGLHPHDDTSLILQNISIQDMINKRWRQIDKNVDSQNNGIIVSGKAFTEDQASQAAAALRRGIAIRVPNGDVTTAAQRFAAPNLPSDIFNNLEDGRSELRNIFGTSGSTPQGVQQEKSVRGKIMVSQQDSSRIGGGITEQIEQVADTIYNLVVQFMFVYYDEEHFVLTSGSQEGAELYTLKNDKFPLLKSLSITVKEGSLIPKDPLTQRNEAIDLWSANAIDPLNFFKKLDFPDPVNATQQLILWQLLQKGAIQPQQYLPSFQVPAQAPIPPQPGQGGEGVGGNAINPLGQAPQQPQASPASPEAIGAQSQQLIQSMPIH